MNSQIIADGLSILNTHITHATGFSHRLTKKRAPNLFGEIGGTSSCLTEIRHTRGVPSEMGKANPFIPLALASDADEFTDL